MNEWKSQRPHEPLPGRSNDEDVICDFREYFIFSESLTFFDIMMMMSSKNYYSTILSLSCVMNTTYTMLQ